MHSGETVFLLKSSMMDDFCLHSGEFYAISRRAADTIKRHEWACSGSHTWDSPLQGGGGESGLLGSDSGRPAVK